MTLYSLSRSWFPGLLFFGIFGFALTTEAGNTPSQEDSKLSPAQELVFGTRHLQNINSPTTLVYSISGHSLNGVNFHSSATLEVFKLWPNGSRGTEAVFPTIQGPKTYTRNKFCCNPMIMYFLEWDTQRTFYETGVSRFYIRTRLREAFYDASLEGVDVVFKGKKTKAKVVVIKPFAGEEAKHLAGRLADREYRLVLADKVPGMVLSIKVTSPADKEKGLTSENLELAFKDLRG